MNRDEAATNLRRTIQRTLKIGPEETFQLADAILDAVKPQPSSKTHCCECGCGPYKYTRPAGYTCCNCGAAYESETAFPTDRDIAETIMAEMKEIGKACTARGYDKPVQHNEIDAFRWLVKRYDKLVSDRAACEAYLKGTE